MKSLKLFGAALVLAAFPSLVVADSTKTHDGHEQTAAMAGEVKLGDLTLAKGWTRATPKSAPVGAGFLSITNNGKAADRLLSVSTSIADRGEVHTMSMTDGVMKMRRLDEGLEIPAGKTVLLKPGGFHLMLIGLKRHISKGETIDVHLTFEKAGVAKMSLHAAPIGARKPMMHHNHGG